MNFVKRIFFFVALNFLVLLTISFVLGILGVRPYLNEQGIDYNSLLIFCLIWGMAGALISLCLSRKMAKWMMRIQVIDPNTASSDAKQLYEMVAELSRRAAIPVPEVGIYPSEEVNAFATGPTKKRSLVAVSSGLLRQMHRGEVEGVLAHEVTHIANGDMVTMTLLQGVVNAFVMFLARVLAYAFTRGRQSSSGSYGSFILFTWIFEILFMLLGSMVIAGFSRYREFRADRGGADLAGKEKMISALEALQSIKEGNHRPAQNSAFSSLKIKADSSSRFANLFATHPPLEKRISRLKEQ